MMSSDSEPSTQMVVDNIIEEDQHVDLIEPSTPQDHDALASSSQQTIPSTEAPASPIDPVASFKTELNDDPISVVIPSSLTPPPSSQVPTQRLSIYPTIGVNGSRRDGSSPSDYMPPTPQQLIDSSSEDLRSMLLACVAEHAKLKMETAHYKLQYKLLSMQADEDAKRAVVEHEMTRREVEALRTAEHSRQARCELSASESIQAQYLELKIWYEQTIEENEALHKRLKLAKKVIQQKEDEVLSLTDERDMFLNRIRENREHFHLLCSPGGIFHGALTPKTVSSPVQHRVTPRQTPRSGHHDARPDRDQRQENFAVLLQVLSQENNSAPSTPTTSSHRQAPRVSSKHTRNVQSMSSLPTTPTTRDRSRGDHGGLLPSVNLVPQSEPPHRHSSRFVAPDTYTPQPARHRERRKSRESTISAEDNEELARQALQSVAAASFASHASQGKRGPVGDEDNDDEEVFESQASQAASEMLRRDPRQSFDVADSRDPTPVPGPAEKTAKLQAKLFAGLNKSGASTGEKRKVSGSAEALSPTKKLRTVGGLRGDTGRVGLGIQYGQET